MTTFKKIVLSAFAVLALLFIFACSDSSSSNSDDNIGGVSSSSVVIWQSSSSKTSSSSVSQLSSSSAIQKSSSSSIMLSSSSSSLIQSSSSKEKFTDTRDEQVYEYVTIGDQVWMAENLNYNVTGSKCYRDLAVNCVTFGRLYDWATTMNGAASSSDRPSGVQGICPSGWHIPSDTEWIILTNYIAGTKLKSVSGWSGWSMGNGALSSGNGTDDYGFSALPGGSGYSSGGFNGVGEIGYWWSATEFDRTNVNYGNDAYYCDITSRSVSNRYHSDKTDLYSVRCIRD